MIKKKKKWHLNKNSGKWKEDEITDLSCIYNKGVQRKGEKVFAIKEVQADHTGQLLLLILNKHINGGREY